jgi:cytochrome c oxidase assembly protein subunit 15
MAGMGYDAWTHRLSLAALLCAVPLVLFGGSVTTLGAGMAVDGWWIAEGHFLLFFPIESWLRDTHTFVEHTHRLFGILVGLLALAAFMRAFGTRLASAARFTGFALLGVILQGTLGGLRVLEDSSDLAFLHGVLAQVVFAGLALAVVGTSRDFASRFDQRGPASAEALQVDAVLRRRLVFALTVLLAEIGLGAWLRHGLRAAVARGAALGYADLRLALHIGGAFFVFAALVAAARALALAGRMDTSAFGRSAKRSATRLRALLLVQVLLGLCTWAGQQPGSIGPLEWGLSIAHVLTGALILAETSAALVWSLRRAASVPRARLVLEAAR